MDEVVGFVVLLSFFLPSFYMRDGITDVVYVGTFCQVIPSPIVTLSLLLIARSTATAKVSQLIVVPNASPTWPSR